MVGDSTAELTGLGLTRWAATAPERPSVAVRAAPGCGLVPGGERVTPDRSFRVPVLCSHYLDVRVPRAVREVRPDVVLVMSSWETQDRRWDGGPVLAPADPPYRARMVEHLTRLVRSIRDAGASKVVLVLEPEADPFWRAYTSPQEDPGRHQVLHDVMADAAAADPGHVLLADVGGWLVGIGGQRDPTLRPDGVHWSPDAATLLAADLLGPLLLAAAR